MAERDPGSDDQAAVLCIEDDESLGQLLSLMLRRIPGVRVTLVGTRQEALQRVAATRWDLVLTDLNLPDASGVAWVAELVDLPALLGAPVVVVSADAAPRTVDTVTACGVADYLTKPVSRRQLIALVSRLLDLPSEEPAVAPIRPDEAPTPTLMERCLAESALDLGQLHDALARGDIERFADLRHRLQGRAMMYGMTEVGEALHRIEVTFRPDQLELADRLVDRADDALERFRIALAS